jgi:hypothetical protein
MPSAGSVRLETSVSPQRTDRRSIYGGLAISLVGIALIFVTTWLLDFGLAGKVVGLVCGATLTYLGWVLTERS